MTLDQLVGRNVHMILWERDLDQKDIAPKLGMQQSALSKKLRGRRKWTLDEIWTIAETLGVDPRTLLPEWVAGDSNPEPTDLVATVFHRAALALRLAA